MTYDTADLRTLMARLRDPDTGCPWDLKQSFKSIVPHTLEEVYELVDAIENDQTAQIRQELGDVLFQIVFYCQLAEENGDYNFDDVVNEITEKLLRRHPHVFPSGNLDERRNSHAPSDAEIKAKWEQIKQAERGEKSQHSLMDDVPLALPALTRAAKMQKRARQLGFDWENIAAVMQSLEGEIAELQHEIESDDRQKLADEMGDVMFSAINLCRHLDLDPETTLRAATAKFERRFRYVEQRAAEAGVQESPDHNPQLDMFWTEAKQQGL